MVIERIDWPNKCLTKDSEAIVECDDNDLAVRRKDSTIKQVAGSPRKTLPVDEYHDGKLGPAVVARFAVVRVVVVVVVCGVVRRTFKGRKNRIDYYV